MTKHAPFPPLPPLAALALLTTLLALPNARAAPHLMRSVPGVLPNDNNQQQPGRSGHGIGHGSGRSLAGLPPLPGVSAAVINSTGVCPYWGWHFRVSSDWLHGPHLLSSMLVFAFCDCKNIGNKYFYKQKRW
jgi:hypothetical protein